MRIVKYAGDSIYAAAHRAASDSKYPGWIVQVVEGNESTSIRYININKDCFIRNSESNLQSFMAGGGSHSF